MVVVEEEVMPDALTLQSVRRITRSLAAAVTAADQLETLKGDGPLLCLCPTLLSAITAGTVELY
jgi:hypothetical protein